MRVLVCGGRTFADKAHMISCMDAVHSTEGPITQLIHGGANGADTMSGEWARTRNVPVKVYHADWRKHGNSAGPKRNQLMLIDGKPDLVVAFPGGKGTAHMVRIAKAAGVTVMEVG